MLYDEILCKIVQLAKSNIKPYSNYQFKNNAAMCSAQIEMKRPLTIYRFLCLTSGNYNYH